MTTSPFAIRGVIEGFYGPPWTHAQRLDMIDFIAERGMNTFLYSPKDDPFLRQRWREPYDGDRLAAVTELHRHAADRGVTFIPGLSPGLSMRYSSPGDRAALIHKFTTLVDAGIESIVLLLDDIPARLQHPADQVAFDSIAVAHADLTNAVHAALGDRAAIMVCPLQYWGRGDEPYIVELGKSVVPQVDIMWTGRAICAPYLDLDDAARISRTLHRPVTYWDNYPVNDVAMTGELHIGPYRQRDADLARFSRGILANAMEHAESSKIALATIADYLADPHGYDPGASWERAIQRVAGSYPAAYRIFADSCQESCLSADHAPGVTQAIDQLLFGNEYGEADRARREFADFVDQLRAAAADLNRGIEDGIPLLLEAQPWIAAFSIGIDALDEIGRAVAGNPDLERLTSIRDRLHATGVRIFGDVVTMTLDDLIRTHAPSDPRRK